jgi:hypothetical protein
MSERMFFLLFSICSGSIIDFPPDSIPRIPNDLFAESSFQPMSVPGDELATSLIHSIKAINVNKTQIFVGLGVNRTTLFGNAPSLYGKSILTIKWEPNAEDIENCLNSIRKVSSENLNDANFVKNILSKQISCETEILISN